MNKDEYVTYIARITHAANREYQRVLLETSRDNGVGISPPWDLLDDHTRASIKDGVLAVHEGADPEASHENWCAFKRADGWIYGVKKDSEAKTHPCLVPYAELPKEQRVKDDLFGAVVKALW